MKAICEACDIPKKVAVIAIERIHGGLSDIQLRLILQGCPNSLVFSSEDSLLSLF